MLNGVNFQELEGRLRKFPRWGDVHTEVWAKASDACEEEEDPCPVHSGESGELKIDKSQGPSIRSEGTSG